jgi:putative transposase
MNCYHVWFGTKRRKEALADHEVSEAVKASFRAIALRTDVELIEVETAVDHVHLLVALPDGRTLSAAMHDLKGAAAREVFLRFPDLKADMPGALWQKSFGWRQIRPEEIPVVRHYIRTQDQRDIRHN